MRTNLSSPLEKAVARLQGGDPNPGSLAQWIARDPLYKLVDSVTAIRLVSTSGLPAVLMNWETFATLRNAKRAVEFVYYPQGDHNLEMPLEQLASAGGNVDWFRFWLQGYEDPDPVKIEQYAR